MDEKARKLRELEEAERNHRSAARTARHYWGGNPNQAVQDRYIDLRREFIRDYGRDELPEHMRP